MEALESRQMLTVDFGPFDHKLLDTDGQAFDAFGRVVAVSGDIAIVGAYADDDYGVTSGSAFVFNTTTGQRLFKLNASDAAGSDSFGYSVAISGNIAIVGAPGESDAAGAAYVFNVVTGQQLFKLTASDGFGVAHFGISVALSGNTAIIGAWLDGDGGDESGSAYLFNLSTGQQMAKLTASDGEAGDHFGYSVAISGNLAIVGAFADDDENLGSDSGSVYVFNATTAQPLAKLTADDGAAGDNFGVSVAIAGTVAVIGASADDGLLTDSGSAYLFNIATGEQEAKLTADAGYYFGGSVAISGSYALVGASYDDDVGAGSGSAFLFSLSTGQELAKITAGPDAAAGDFFGVSVAISGDTIVVGADRDDDLGTDSGAAYVFRARVSVYLTPAGEPSAFPLYDEQGQPIGVTQTLYEGQTARFQFSRTGPIADSERVYFQISGEATFSDDVVGDALAAGYVDIPAGQSSTTVNVVLRNVGEIENQFRDERLIVTLVAASMPVRADRSTAQIEIADLVGIAQKASATDGAASDQFGYSVAISGNIAIVGAHGDDDRGDGSGSAYVYNLTTGQQLFKLTASDGSIGDGFGCSVAISGNIAIIGAVGDDDLGGSSGSAYLFNIATGQQVAKLTASDGSVVDYFGNSVAISGNIAIIGAWGDDDRGAQSGSAYLFNITTGQQVAKLTASDGTADDQFGHAVAISGQFAVIGAFVDNFARGSAYVFNIATGQQVAKLTANDGAEQDRFGYSVSISGDIAIIGAYGDNDRGPGSGSAYLFNINGQMVAKLTASDGAGGDQFGISVAITGDIAVIGAYGDNDRGQSSGSAYLFNTITGQQVAKLTAFDGAEGDLFGGAVAIGSNSAIIGALGDDDRGVNSGSFYLLGPRSVSVDLVDASGQPIGSTLFNDQLHPIGTSHIISESQIARLRFNRTGMLDRPLRVYFNIAGEADPSDFQGASLFSGFVDIPAGQFSTILEIPLTADGRPDAENQFINERLIITLDTDALLAGQQGNPTGDLVRDLQGRWVPRPGGLGAEFMYEVVPGAWTASIEIVDVDAKFVKIESANATGGELGDSVSYTVTRGGDLSGPLTVDLDISGTATGGLTAQTPGVDYWFLPASGLVYNPASGVLSITIPAGQRTFVFTALPINDTLEEGIEWIHAEIIDQPGLYRLTTDPERRQSRTGFIDDDMSSLMLRSIAGEMAEGGGPIHFQVSRSGLAYTGSALTANIVLDGLGTTALSSDYILRRDNPTTGQVLTATGGGFYEVTLIAGQAFVDLYLVPVDDAIAERDERILARLISGSAYLNHPTLSRAELVIRDNDRSNISILVSDANAGETNRNRGEFVLVRSGGTLNQRIEVTVVLGGTSVWGLDYEPVSRLVVFEANESIAYITLMPVQDQLAEGMEFVLVQLVGGGEYNVDASQGPAILIIADLIPGQTRAMFDWWMPDRYGIDQNNDGRIDVPNTAAYANPAGGFEVTFDASLSTSGTSQISYAWTIYDSAGVPIDQQSVVMFTRRLPEARYTVTLLVTDANNGSSESTQVVEVNDILVVSMGDSVASGEGNPEVGAYNSSPFGIWWTNALGRWADDGVSGVADPDGPHTVEYDHASAHRSTLAASSLTALEIEQRDRRSSVTFVFVAQSGAGVLNGVVTPKDGGFDGFQPNQYSQIEQVNRMIGDRPIDSLLISVGSNDIDFGDAVTKYVKRFVASVGFWVFSARYESESLDSIAQYLNVRLARLPHLYAVLNAALQAEFGSRLPSRENIVLQGYHDPTSGSDGQPAEVLGDYTSGLLYSDAISALGGLANDLVSWLTLGGTQFEGILHINAEEAAHGRAHAVIPLNLAVQRAASTYGWTFLPAPAGFSTRGYSATPSWVVSATESRIMQGGSVLRPSGSLHPNAAGHRAYSESLLATFLGDGPATVSLPPLISVVEGGSAQISATVTVAPNEQFVGGVTYEWDLNFNGRVFNPTPGIVGSSATVTRLYGANTSENQRQTVAVRITDRLGRSSYAVTEVQTVNGSSGRAVYDVTSVNAGEPFWLGLERIREAFDPVSVWRVDWGDGTSELVPADWRGRTKIYQFPGQYNYRVWLTDAAGEIEVQGGTIQVVRDDPFPRVSVQSIANQAGERDGGRLRFRFDRSGQVNLPLSISIGFGTGQGWAINGVDFTSVSGEPVPLSVFFPAGQSMVELEIVPRADSDEAEGAETVELAINPSSLYAVTIPAAIGVITDGLSIERGDIRGMVFDDVNGNGVRDAGEAFESGWQVLLDLDQDGVADVGEPVVVTDSGGNYTHPLQLPGQYRLLLLPRSGWVGTAPVSRLATVETSTTTSGQDFAVARPVVVRGSVFADDDIDGVLDAGELGRDGVLVFVDSNANGVFDPGEPSTLSGATGEYELFNVPPGNLLIRAQPPEGWTNTNGSQGGAIGVVAMGGATVTGLDLGQRQIAPEVTSLSIGRGVIVSGDTVTLLALGVDPWTRTVRFYRESNGVPGVQTGAGGDIEIGQDGTSGDGWSLQFRAGLEAGQYVFYALADDGDGQLQSDGPSVGVTVTGSPGPTVAGMRALTGVIRENGTLAAAFEVYRTGGNADALTVNLFAAGGAGFTTDGVDHAALPTSVTIPAGQDVVLVFVPIPDDAVLESEELLRLQVAPGSGYATGTESYADVVIRDASSTPAVVSVLSARVDPSRGITVLEISMSEDVRESLSVADVRLLNLDTGIEVPASAIAFTYDPITGVARFAVPTAGDGSGALPPGRYRLTLNGAGVFDSAGRYLDGNGDGVAGDDFVFEFTAAAMWDGEAGDFDWLNPLNWVENVLPTVLQEVVIPVGGEAHLTNAGTVSVVGVQVFGAIWISNATLNLASTLRIEAGGAGQFNGAGIAGSMVSAGDIDLGASTLAITGSFTQLQPGRLRTTLSASSGYGRIVAAGAATLAGALEATLAAGFTPSLYSRFDVVSAGSRAGAFTSTITPAPPTLHRWAMLDGPNGVQLLFTTVADMDNSGSLTPSDIAAFVSLWFSSLSQGGLAGDFNGNGVVEPADIAVFVSLWVSLL